MKLPVGHRRINFFCLMYLLLLLIPSQSALAAAATFAVTGTGLRGGDEVCAFARKNKLYIEVRKKSGIGGAAIKLKSGQWPDTAQVRFFGFSSLEAFTASGGAKVDLLEAGAREKRRTFTIELLPLNVEAHDLQLNWVDAYRH